TAGSLRASSVASTGGECPNSESRSTLYSCTSRPGWPQHLRFHRAFRRCNANGGLRLRAKSPPLPSSLATDQGERDNCNGTNRQPVIWFEVEDFLRYFDHFRNPSGMQRVPFEIYRVAETLYGLSGRVRFCRLSVYSNRLHTVGFDAIRSAYLNPPGSIAPWKTFWEPAIFWQKFPRSIPVIVRHPRFFFSIFKVAVRDLIGTLLRTNRFEQSVRRGDMVVLLGAGWGIPNYMKHMAEAKRCHGI